MILNYNLVSNAIQISGVDLQGVDFPALANGVALGVCNWVVVPSNFALTGVCTGTAGAGTTIGRYIVTPNIGLVLSGLQGAGLSGVQVNPIARAIAVGVATAFTASATYQGVATGVGTGVDNAWVSLSNPTTLGASIQAALNGMGYNGINISPLSFGLGVGLASMLQTGTGTGTVTGASGPTPATGTSISRIV
mgnify:CR=1 FL=1